LQRNKLAISGMNAVQLITLNTQRLSMLFRYNPLLSDGRLLYRLKKQWCDGTSHIVFHPHELMERLVALVLAPRFNTIRYSGVFAPASGWCRRIVPQDVISETESIAPKAALSGTPHQGIRRYLPVGHLYQ